MNAARRPQIVMVVQNDVSGDTRVKKTALSLASAGCEVTVYGFSKDGRPWETMIGSVRIIRLADPARTYRRRRGLRRPPLAYRTQAALDHALGRREGRRARVVSAVTAWKSRIDARQERLEWAGHRTLTDRLTIASLWYRIKGRRVLAVMPELVFRLRLSSTRGQGVTTTVVRKIRRLVGLRSSLGEGSPGPADPLAHLLRLEEQFKAALQKREEPVDALHAHDFFTIGMVRRAAQMLSPSGDPVPWIYDAHEYVSGLDFFTPARRAAALQLESEHISAAAQVVTVTPELAARLHSDYGLKRRPAVVLNAPAQMDRPAVSETVRTSLGLASEVPLLVYAGQVKEPRDVHTLVAALAFLPGVHLAILTANAGAYVDGLAQLAAEVGAADRYHRLPYVASHAVSSFLRDADVGVVPLSHYGNAEVALPTKLFEYLHARLPMVVSDTQAMRSFVEALAIGEVFVAGEARSLAEAARAVLANRERYIKPMESDPELLMRYSWQHQERVLLDVYSVILGQPVVPTDAAPTSLEEHHSAREEATHR